MAPAVEGVDPQTLRLETSRSFAIAAARMAADTRCHNVILLQVTGLSPVTDFFLIASGTSPRQMRSACEEIEEMAQLHDYRAITRSGYESQSWMLTDYVDMVVHVFSDDARHYYDLDNLWGDAPRIEWRMEKATA